MERFFGKWMQKFFIEREGGSKTNYVISCSFGKDSLAQVILAHQHGEPVEYILYVEVMYDIERNISAEIPEHRDFIYNIAIPKLQEWGYRVIILRSEKDFKHCFLREIKKSRVPGRNGKRSGFPLSGKCAINRDCKQRVIDRYKKLNFSKDTTFYVGIAVDEKKRLARLDGVTKQSLLEKYGYTEKKAKDLCAEHGLLSPIYSFTKRNGCFFCPNASRQELRHLYDHHPELWNDLLRLSYSENLVSPYFNGWRKETFADVHREFQDMTGGKNMRGEG